MIVGDLTADEVATRIGADTVVVQPIGAVEQHGPHLPLIADSLIVEAVASRVERATDIALLPTITYGKSIEHQWSAGTIVLSTATVLSLLADVGRSVQRTGARTLVFLNGHGGNNAALTTVARDLHGELGLLTYVVHPFLAYVGTSETDPVDFHAGHSETSVLLHLAPDLVRLDRATANPPGSEGRHVGLDGSVDMAWSSNEFGDGSGTIGDPTGANAADGAAIVESMVTYVVECIEEIRSHAARR